MRPALVRAGALFASLLTIALPVVRVASADGAEAVIKAHVGSFSILAIAGESKGKQSMLMMVRRRHQYAEYIVPAELTDSTLKARFGSLGEIDYSFGPKKPGDPKCFGATETGAAFTGTFSFVGEGGYIHVDADRATGTYANGLSPRGCKLPSLPHRAATSARAIPGRPFTGEGATLTAVARSKGSRQTRVITVARELAAKSVAITAFLEEVEPQMVILRGAQMTAPGRSFEWDFGTGAATVGPPAPFTGTASFSRHPGGGTILAGSLRVPILGGKPVSMAGPAFHAVLHHGTQHEG
jgi:hypothetical protein